MKTSRCQFYTLHTEILQRRVCINRPEVGVEVQRINAALIDTRGQAYGDTKSLFVSSPHLLSCSVEEFT